MALAQQASEGGRIGSTLIDLGFAHADNVARALALQHGVPAASEQAFLQIDPRIVGVVPRASVEKHCLLPLAIDNRTLHLAMRDPQDLALIDALGARLGFTISAYAAPEFRLLIYLQRHYQLPWPQRYLLRGGGRHTASAAHTGPGYPAVPATAPHASASRPIRPIATEPAAPRAGAAPGPSASPGGLTRVPTAAPRRKPAVIPQAVPPPALDNPPEGEDSSLELVYLDEVSRTLKPKADAPGAAGAAAPESEEDDAFELEIEIDLEIDEEAEIPRSIDERLSAVELIGRLQQAKDRESVIGLLLQPIFEGTTLNLVLLPKGELATGLAAVGSDLERGQVRGLMVPLNAPSLAAEAFKSQEVARGSADPFQLMIASFLRVPSPKEVCVTPVCLNNKVVNLLCTQSDRPLPAGATFDLTQVASQAATAFRRIILSKRKES